VEDAYQASLKAEENWPGRRAKRAEEGVQQEERDHPTEEDFRLQRKKQEVLAVSHLEEESQEVEDSSQEAEAEVEKSGVILVGKHDICLGIV
jgi:hypothetical protein